MGKDTLEQGIRFLQHVYHQGAAAAGAGAGLVGAMGENFGIGNPFGNTPIGGDSKPRSKSKMGPRRKVGTKYGNQGGRSNVYQKKKKRKGKKRINVVKEIRKMKKEAAIEENSRVCTFVKKTLNPFLMNCVNGEKSVLNERSLATLAKQKEFVNAVKQVYLDQASEGVNNSVDYTSAPMAGTDIKVQFFMKLVFKNNDEFPCHLVINNFLCVKDSGQTVTDVYGNMRTDQLTNHSSVTEMVKDMRYTYSDSRDLHKYWKSTDRVHIYMKPGDEFVYYAKTQKFRYDVDEEGIESHAYQNAKTRIIACQIYGVPCHSVVTPANVGTTPCNQVDCIQFETMKSWFTGFGNTAYYETDGLSSRGNLANVTDPVTAGVAVDATTA